MTAELEFQVICKGAAEDVATTELHIPESSIPPTEIVEPRQLARSEQLLKL